MLLMMIRVVLILSIMVITAKSKMMFKSPIQGKDENNV